MGHAKEELRKVGIQELKKIANSGEKQEKEQRIYHKLYQSEKWRQANVIGITMSNAIEVSTRSVIETAFKEGKTVVVPKTLAKRQMCFFQIDQKTVFEQSNFGVLEPISDTYYSPEKIDLLIVPGIVYHPNGYRIGFGGGYYDRYLTKYPNDTCSLVFHEQINDQWFPESFDIKIQQLFTD